MSAGKWDATPGTLGAEWAAASEADRPEWQRLADRPDHPLGDNPAHHLRPIDPRGPEAMAPRVPWHRSRERNTAITAMLVMAVVIGGLIYLIFLLATGTYDATPFTDEAISTIYVRGE